MSVSLRASNAGGANVGSMQLPFTINIPAGLSNSILICGMNANPEPASGVKLDSNSAALTKLNVDLNDGASNFNQVYYLLNPPSGVQTVDVPGVASKGAFLAVFDGVDQVTPFGTEVSTGGTDDTASPLVLTPTVLAGGMVFDLVTWFSGLSATPVPDASQTLFTGCPTDTGGGTTDQLCSGSTKSRSGAGTVAMQWTTSGGALQILGRAVPLNPAGGGGGGGSKRPPVALAGGFYN